MNIWLKTLAVLGVAGCLAGCGGMASSTTVNPPAAAVSPVPPTTAPHVAGVAPLPGEQQVLFAYPADAPLQLEERGLKEEAGVTVRDIVFTSPAGARVTAFLVLPAGEGPHPGVLYVHWLGRSLSNRNQFLDEAIEQAQHGIVGILVDDAYSSTRARNGWMPGSAAGDRQEVIDQVIELRQALDILVSVGKADPARIGVVGHDFGGMFASLLAAVDQRVKAAAIMAAVPDFSQWFLIGGLPKETTPAAYKAALADVAPRSYVGHSSARLLFQFANRDEFVSRRDAQALLDAATPEAEARWYDGGHALHRSKNAASERRAWLRHELGVE